MFTIIHSRTISSNSNIKHKKLQNYLVFDPKVAFLLTQHLENLQTERTKHVREAIELMKTKNVDFDYDGEMQPDVALNPEYKGTYPFSKIVGNANVLIMPALHSASYLCKN